MDEPTWDERRSGGRERRQRAPRSSHADWAPPAARDPLATLAAQDRTRVAELVPIRYGRMVESPFAFFRGGAAVMAADLASTPTSGLIVQACGDAHVNNFGKFATPERNVVFDINDFDETLPGPWEWDVKRLAASLHVAARQHGFTARQCDRVVRAAVRSYRERMSELAELRTLPLWYERTEVRDVLAHFPRRYRPQLRRDVRKAKRKSHRRAIAKFTNDAGGAVRFVEDPPLLVHLDDAGHEMAEAHEMLERYRTTLADDRRHLLDRFRLADVARKVVGVGSVGTRCWICLFEGPDRPGGDHLVLQVKEAQASVLEAYVGVSSFDHPGRRVVAGQRSTQAASDIFLGWTEGPESNRTYYVRQLWDVKGQSDLTKMDLGSLSHYGALCAMALARAHARTGDVVELAAYLGGSTSFDRAIAVFAAAYALVNERDHADLAAAIADGQVEAQLGI
jgi:uncharacterized protein (DUF2252 family)